MSRLHSLAGRVKRAGLRAERFILDVAGPVLAPIVSRMAVTGAGTDACVRRGALPMPVHFYSPVLDVPDLDDRGIWTRRSELGGIAFDVEGQLGRLAELGKRFGDECDWSAQPSGDPRQFFSENGGFSFGCAAATHCLVRENRPRRVIEIGSGNSSLVIASALRANGDNAQYTVVDPYPGPIVSECLDGVTQVLAQRAETVDPEFFDQLASGDVLFVDSGHTVRAGGDVNFLILEVLPRLQSGVIVHFHDIPMPSEYPRTYAANPAFRVFWTESYLLQAFLAFNSGYDVWLAMSYLMTDQSERFREAFPHYDQAVHIASSGSFWIRRR